MITKIRFSPLRIHELKITKLNSKLHAISCARGQWASLQSLGKVILTKDFAQNAPSFKNHFFLLTTCVYKLYFTLEF